MNANGLKVYGAFFVSPAGIDPDCFHLRRFQQVVDVPSEGLSCADVSSESGSEIPDRPSRIDVHPGWEVKTPEGSDSQICRMIKANDQLIRA
jgi:hypothetical protein